MSLKHAENKIGKSKIVMRGSKAYCRHFCGAGNTYDWFNQIIAKNDSGLQYSFHLNTKVNRYSDAKLNVNSDVLRDREGGFSKNFLS